MTATIKDVAQRAKVATSTASMVLRQRPSALISEATRQRVLEAARELNYRPNLSARSLRSRKTFVVGMVMTRLRWHDCLELAYPVEEFFRAHDYHVITGFSNADALEERRYVEEMTNGRVDGVMVQPVRTLNPSVLEFYETMDFPIVLLDGPDGTRLPSVKKNRQEGIVLAVRHLYSLGRRHIGLGIVSPRPSYFSGKERLEGYRRVLEELGLPYEEELLLSGGSSPDYFKDGRELAADVVAHMPPMDAIICANDVYAIGLMQGLAERGVKVPEDISVMGFTNLAASEYQSIPLTTIDHNHELIARTAAQMLWDLMCWPEGEAPPEPVTIVVPPRLVVRESCGARLFGYLPENAVPLPKTGS
ncbi:LacI family DNA-binding transcriptional regulator [bacterium]|nr:LacI family DNA-binding transcriptional regulator [bacterium]